MSRIAHAQVERLDLNELLVQGAGSCVRRRGSVPRDDLGTLLRLGFLDYLCHFDLKEILLFE